MPGEFEIVIANRQRKQRLNSKFIRELTTRILENLKITRAELGLHFVSAKEMARVHKQFMNIEGSTDVITFDHGSEPPKKIHGEIFISIDDAKTQAREFSTTWQSETGRYIIHGILHLLGFDDLKPHLRRDMKREENRLVKLTEREFDLRLLSKT